MIELSSETIRLISSTQVITTIVSVVKELIENSLDAQSDSIEIKLENDGLAKIEVIDNGTGIDIKEIHKLCAPHCTSKISNEKDLFHLVSYGFRGEALSSLCAVANVTVISKTNGDEIANIHHFDVNGNLLDSRPVHNNNGTTVIVKDIFKSFPVRRQIYQNKKRLKHEIKLIEELLISYSLLHPKIRLILRVNKNLIFEKHRDANVENVISNIFGAAVMKNFCNIHLVKDMFEISGYIPAKNSDPDIVGRPVNDRIFVSVNNRPVKIKDVSSIMKQFFTEHCCKSGAKRFPIAVINMNVNKSLVDVNVEPNKNVVNIEVKDEVIAALTSEFEKMYGSKFCSNDISYQNSTTVASDILDFDVESSTEKTSHEKALTNGIKNLIDESLINISTENQNKLSTIKENISSNESSVSTTTDSNLLSMEENHNTLTSESAMDENVNDIELIEAPIINSDFDDIIDNLFDETSPNNQNKHSEIEGRVENGNNDNSNRNKGVENNLHCVIMKTNDVIRLNEYDKSNKTEAQKFNLVTISSPVIDNAKNKSSETIVQNIADSSEYTRINLRPSCNENNLRLQNNEDNAKQAINMNDMVDLHTWSKGHAPAQVMDIDPVEVVSNGGINSRHGESCTSENTNEDSVKSINTVLKFAETPSPVPKIRKRSIDIKHSSLKKKSPIAKVAKYQQSYSKVLHRKKAQSRFSFEEIKQKHSNVKSRSVTSENRFHVIGRLCDTSYWIVRCKQKLFITDRKKLSEEFLYKTLCLKHKFTPQLLKKPYHLHKRDLVDERFAFLSQQDTYFFEEFNDKFLKLDHLILNGILMRKKCNITLDNEDVFLVTHAPELFPDDVTLDHIVKLIDQCMDNIGVENRLQVYDDWCKREAIRLEESSVGEYTRAEFLDLVIDCRAKNIDSNTKNNNSNTKDIDCASQNERHLVNIADDPFFYQFYEVHNVITR